MQRSEHINMTENEAEKYFLSVKDDFTRGNRTASRNNAYETALSWYEEIQQYRKLEQRLKSVYGECDGLLEIIVNGLVKYENAPDKAIKAVLLTDTDVEKWEHYRANGTGTVEECKVAVMNFAVAVLAEVAECAKQEDAPLYEGDREVDSFVKLSDVNDAINKHLNEAIK